MKVLIGKPTWHKASVLKRRLIIACHIPVEVGGIQTRIEGRVEFSPEQLAEAGLMWHDIVEAFGVPDPPKVSYNGLVVGAKAAGTSATGGAKTLH